MFHEYDNRSALTERTADALAQDLGRALAARPHVSFAVCGGSTPGPVFDRLSTADLDWRRVRIFLTDERWVDESSSRSNAAMLRARLLVGRASAAQFIPLYAPGLDLRAGAAHLADVIASYLPISVAVLGMGDDMHTASLFAGADGFAAALADDAPAVCPIWPPATEPRVSLSAGAINAAMAKHLLIAGENKRRAWKEAENLPVSQAPIRAIAQDLTIHWAP